MAQTKQPSFEYITGRNPVTEALRSETTIDSLYIDQNCGGLSDIIHLAHDKSIPIKMVNTQKLSQLTDGAPHQGVVLALAPAKYTTLEEILEATKTSKEPPLLVLCDGIEDPHNLGAIIRTAEAAGAHGVIIPKRRSATLTQTVAKTSAGAVAHLPVARVSNLAQTIITLQEHNIWVYGTDMNGELYTTGDYRGGTAFVIGSEGFGLSRLVKQSCDACYRLPMRGKVNSLNASVATGIFLYEAVRQRMT